MQAQRGWGDLEGAGCGWVRRCFWGIGGFGLGWWVSGGLGVVVGLLVFGFGGASWGGKALYAGGR